MKKKHCNCKVIARNKTRAKILPKDKMDSRVIDPKEGTSEIGSSSSQECDEGKVGTGANGKPGGYDYYRNVLGSPKFAVAPMVDQSELAWRLLSRRYGAELCFTPMFHALNFATDATYRSENMQTCPEDRPLIVQFCANDPEHLLRACEQLNVEECDGVDLNLGCPQIIAKRGNYGAYLMEDWDRVKEMVSQIHEKFQLPISCKIRVYSDVNQTVAYAKMLEAAGCQILTVHGRTRDMKGSLTGLADWTQIRAVKRAVKIPVFANGNIQLGPDVQKCITETEVDGVMSAEGNLYNPALFQGLHKPNWEVAEEYISLVDRYPCPKAYIRGHLFKLFHHCMLLYPDIRDVCGRAGSMAEFRSVVQFIRDKCEPLHREYVRNPESWSSDSMLYPHWICQPYFRNGAGAKSIEPEGLKADRIVRRKRFHETLDALVEETGLSKRRLRKLTKNPEISFDSEKLKSVNSNKIIFAECSKCRNPMSPNCDHQLCRKCCKALCKSAFEITCKGHGFVPKPSRKTASSEKRSDSSAVKSVEQNVGSNPEDTTVVSVQDQIPQD